MAQEGIVFLYSYIGIVMLKQTTGPSLLPCDSDREQMLQRKALLSATQIQ